MSSPASIKDHPIHPMLIPLPIGLLVFSFISDVIYLMRWGGPLWNDIAFYTMLGGIVGALLAAIPGFIDYLSITDPKTKRTGTKHLIANLVVVALYVVNAMMRSTAPDSGLSPFVLSCIGIVLLGYAGWKGGDMVYEHGMAVELTADGRLAKSRPKPYEDPADRAHRPGNVASENH